MCSVTLHYPCVQKIRCKQSVMSEVKEGNENVNHRRKLLNGTNCLREVFVYPCAACLPQSIIRKDKPPRGNECPRLAGRLAGPSSDCPRQQRTHTPSNVSSKPSLGSDCCQLADPEIGRHRAFWPSNTAALQTFDPGEAWMRSLLTGAVDTLTSLHCLHSGESSPSKKIHRVQKRAGLVRQRKTVKENRGISRLLHTFDLTS